MSLQELYKLISNIAAFSVLLPIFFSILRIKVLNKTLWALSIYLLLCFTSDRISLILIGSDDIANIVFNSFTIIECTIICFIYYNELIEKKTRFLIRLALGFFLFLASWIFVFRSGFNKVDSLVSTIEALLIIVISGLSFYHFFIDKKITSLGNHYFYWINVSFLLYFSTSLLLFLNTDFIENCSPRSSYLLWGLHQIISIACNILLSVGIWCMKRK